MHGKKIVSEKNKLLLPGLTKFLIYYMKCLVQFAQYVLFVKREKHPRRIVTFSKVVSFSLQSNTPPWVFFTFFKLCKWYQIEQRIT